MQRDLTPSLILKKHCCHQSKTNWTKHIEQENPLEDLFEAQY
jgi:hypothetical protein